MKKNTLLLLASTFYGMAAIAQPSNLYGQKRIDSIFGNIRHFKLPMNNGDPKSFSLPELNPVLVQQQNSIEEYNPGSVIIGKSDLGTMYKMKLDNMAVLVPDMRKVIKMPGSTPPFRANSNDKMPNPIYRIQVR